MLAPTLCWIALAWSLRDEDNIHDQILREQICSDFYHNILLFLNDTQNVFHG